MRNCNFNDGNSLFSDKSIIFVTSLCHNWLLTDIIWRRFALSYRDESRQIIFDTEDNKKRSLLVDVYTYV